MQIIEPPANSFGRSSANRTFCKSSNFCPTFKPPAQALSRWHQTFTLAEILNKPQLDRTSPKKHGRNNPDTLYRKCSIPSTSFSICTCLVYPERPVENYKTLHRLVSLGKSSERATKRPAKGMISKLLLQEVTYRMLPLLLIIQELFRYR